MSAARFKQAVRTDVQREVCKIQFYKGENDEEAMRVTLQYQEQQSISSIQSAYLE